jgi:hypothetical protein
MSEMIERVARAIYEDAWGIEWPPEPAGEADEYRRGARAAIEAMREPTEAMLSAAGTRRPRGDEVMGPDHPWALWDAMIDAALKETVPITVPPETAS